MVDAGRSYRGSIPSDDQVRAGNARFKMTEKQYQTRYLSSPTTLTFSFCWQGFSMSKVLGHLDEANEPPSMTSRAHTIASKMKYEPSQREQSSNDIFRGETRNELQTKRLRSLCLQFGI